MARIDLRCGGCGYVFFVSDVQLQKPGGVKCPSCMRPVGLEGPADAPAGKTADRALRAARKGPSTGLIVGGAAAALLVAGGAAFFLMGGKEEPPPEAPLVRRVTAPPPATPVSAPKPAPAAAPKPKPAPAPAPVAAPAPAPRPAPAPVPAALPDASTIPAPEALAGLKELLGLNPYYVGLLLSGPEKERMTKLAASGSGPAADVEFARLLVDGPKAKAVRDELAALDEAVRKLEAEALENLPTDKVVMTDNRVLFGKVIEETPERVKLQQKRSGGFDAVMPLSRPDVKEVAKGKGPGGEFRTRWTAAKASSAAPELSALLGWCKQNSMPMQATLVASLLARVDPASSDARSAAGLASDPVARAVEADKQGGFILWQGRNWVPRELKEKLLKDGYRLIHGQWNGRRERMISVPGLFRYESASDRPATISGVGTELCHDVEKSYVPMLDPTRGSFVEQVQAKQTRAYWTIPLRVRETPVDPGVLGFTSTPAVEYLGWKDVPDIAPGKPLTGEVYVTVPVNEPVLEAWVTVVAEVRQGSITVNLLHDGKKAKVFVCGAKEDQARKLPDLVVGKTQIDLVADVAFVAAYKTKTAQRVVKRGRKDGNRIIEKDVIAVHAQAVPDPAAILFPSNSNTIEVFRLKVAVGEPAPALDKLFETARDVLKD